MTLSPQLYCDTCGAANEHSNKHCFVCESPLHLPAKEVLLKGRYRVLAPVGQGGFGAVYKVEDVQNANSLLAMKEINLSTLTPQQTIEATGAFHREVLLLSGLSHANLPRIHDSFTDKDHWYLVMDFIEGETLEQYLQRTAGGRMPLAEVLAIGIQLCSVLDYLHSREPSIIFRDLKPANVMRTSNGHLYLIDFGIARHFKPGQLHDTIPLGSPGYAAPEQYGRAQTTPRADIYSLGVLLHQLLTGNNPEQNPFRFEATSLQNHALPTRLQSLILQMVAMDASYRPASIEIVRQTLAEIVAICQPLGTLLFTCQHYRLVLTLAWSPDGEYIVSGAANNALHLWNATTGDHLYTHRDPFKTHAWAASVAWSPDGKYIAHGSDDRTVRIWQVERDASNSIAMRQICVYRGHANWVNVVAWSSDSKCVASGSDDRSVQVSNVEGANGSAGEARGTGVDIYRGHALPVVTLAWSPNGFSSSGGQGSYIASGSNDRTIRIWHVDSKETVLVYREHAFGVNALAWSPNGPSSSSGRGSRIASCSWDNIIRVWDVVSGETCFTYRGHSHWVNAIAWSPDGTRIASAGRDKTVQIWDAVTGRHIYTYTGHAGWVYTVAWSPDGTRIASAGNDGAIHVWLSGPPGAAPGYP